MTAEDRADVAMIKRIARAERWTGQRLRSMLGIYKSGDRGKRAELIRALMRPKEKEHE